MAVAHEGPATHVLGNPPFFALSSELGCSSDSIALIGLHMLLLSFLIAVAFVLVGETQNNVFLFVLPPSSSLCSLYFQESFRAR